jgi:nucleoside-diphosphate-sugar epimerase
MSKNNVAIIGVGWLGFPLALCFKNQGYTVFVGTRNPERIEKFNSFGLVGFEIIYHSHSVRIKLNDSQIDSIRNLIICLPPSRFENYSVILGELVSKFNGKTNIIFTSSTGVYRETNKQVTEDSPIIPDHPVFQAEQKLLEIASKRLTILRLAGLIGDERHPVKYFIKNNLIPNSSAPVNLVCQFDVIRAIVLILERKLFGEIFNIVNPSHPSKKKYYLSAARELFGEIPNVELGNGGKLVLGTKFELISGFSYEHDLEDWGQFFQTTKLI